MPSRSGWLNDAVQGEFAFQKQLAEEGIAKDDYYAKFQTAVAAKASVETKLQAAEDSKADLRTKVEALKQEVDRLSDAPCVTDRLQAQAGELHRCQHELGKAQAATAVLDQAMEALREEKDTTIEALEGETTELEGEKQRLQQQVAEEKAEGTRALHEQGESFQQWSVQLAHETDQVKLQLVQEKAAHQRTQAQLQQPSLLPPPSTALAQQVQQPHQPQQHRPALPPNLYQPPQPQPQPPQPRLVQPHLQQPPPQPQGHQPQAQQYPRQATTLLPTHQNQHPQAPPHVPQPPQVQQQQPQDPLLMRLLGQLPYGGTEVSEAARYLWQSDGDGALFLCERLLSEESSFSFPTRRVCVQLFHR